MKSLGVRKGAWSGEEDLLLRKCIELHGEGKWHLVPQRAGLNRCRKSCRLRWLNYLQPSLNREEFKEDETDLIIKMHKLLGNRWSLIAGRLPRRTANDIKNYWNSNLSKTICSKSVESPHPQRQEKHEVIKPKPTYFRSKVTYHNLESNMLKPQQKENEQNQNCMTSHSEENNIWWNDLFVENHKDSGQSANDANEQILSEDDTLGGSYQALIPKGATFDSSIFEWDDLLPVNDWLMKEVDN